MQRSTSSLYKMRPKLFPAFSLTISVILGVGGIFDVLFTESVSDSKFARNNVGVLFRPPIYQEDGKTPETYSETDLIQLASNVSTRFSKWLVSPVPVGSYGDKHIETRIPIAVAQVNARNNQSRTESSPDAVQLFMGYEILSPYGNTDTLIHYLSTSFYPAKTIADKANRLFKNTVPYLVTWVDNFLNENGIDALVNHLVNTKRNLRYGVNKYKSGVKVGIDECGNAATRVGHFLGKILSHVNLIMLQPSERKEAFCGVIPALQCIQKRMQKCGEKLSRLYPHLEVVFLSGWSRGENSSENNDISDMIHFWQNMNTWALKLNTTVVMYEAFDEPAWSYLNMVGWWKVKKNDSSSVYSIQEQHNLITTPYPVVVQYITNGTNDCFPPTTLKEGTASRNNDSVEGNKLEMFSSTHFGVHFYPVVKDTDDVYTYDEDDIVPFIEKISTRFATVLINPLNEKLIENQWSLSHVPNATAKVNRRKTASTHTVEIILQYELETPEQIQANRLENKPLPFDLVKQVADQANVIFPGTVKYLFLQEFDLSTSKVDSALRQLEYARRQKGNFTYELGLTLKFLDCDMTGVLTTHKKEVTPLMKQVSLVLFDSSLTELVEAGFGVEATYQKMESLLQICSETVRALNPQVQLGFTMSWPDTDTSGKRNVTALTWFWDKMNSWAMETNNLIIMLDAMDIPIPVPLRSSMGWWKFVKDKPCYDNTSEYTFLEKILEEKELNQTVGTDINDGEDSLERNRTLENFLLAGIYNMSFQPPKDKLAFSRQQFGVLFHPFINKKVTGGLYSEKDIEILLGIVETRFSKILMAPVDDQARPLRRSVMHIPSAAAKLNKIKNSGNLKTGSVTENLEVFVSFVFEPLTSTDTALQTSLDFALELAEGANNIFRDTVSYLMLVHEMPMVNSSRWKRAEGQIKYLQQKVNEQKNGTRSHQYQLGGIITAEYCDLENYFAVARQYFLPHLQLVVVRYLTTLPQVASGVNSAFREVTDNFEKCREKIFDAFPDLEVGLLTRWTDTSSTWKKYPFNLVRFWRMMNDYAVANNTLVFLRDAFDHPDHEEDTGWWRLVAETNESGSDVHFVVQEKYQLVYQAETVNGYAEDSTSPEDERGTPYYKVVVATVMAGLVVLLTICGVAIIILRKNRRNAAARQALSEREMVEFFKGSRVKEDEDNTGDIQGRFFEMASYIIKGYAYDTSLELPKQAFVIDESAKLGSGAFGTVCLSRICKDGKEIQAAVKRVNPNTSPEEGLCSLRSLLSEVKVLSFLGTHENVVKLLAVHTGDIRKGEICLFLEPCVLGSLKKYLGTMVSTDNKKANEDYLDLHDEKFSNSKQDQSATDIQLMAQWSLQIAQGMEFLASKHVVHADLATRNVLLDRNKNAKICDFGLSRRMYNYESYVKSKQEPLPWRWMAPESLRRWEFNEQSDVWAYGVTLWEIYTLGEVPYAGLAWDQTFFSRLEKGFRPREPEHDPPDKYNDQEMYQVMLKCWDTEPINRPRFSDLVSLLIHLNSA